MTDLYLQNLMKNQPPSNKSADQQEKNKNLFDIENQINEYSESISFDAAEEAGNQLESPAMKRAKLCEELKEAAKLTELSNFLNEAFEILDSEKATYLENDKAVLMTEEFENAKVVFNEITPDLLSNNDFKTLLKISDSTIDSIFTVASSKFNEEKYAESLSLFVLLGTLIPGSPDYWLRSGIAAQECEKYDLALKMYQTAISLDPNLIAPRAFSIECCLKCDLITEAKNAYLETVKIAEAFDVEPEWRELLLELNKALYSL